MAAIVNALNSEGKVFIRKLPGGVTLGIGIWAFAKVCEQVYQKHRGFITAEKSLFIHALAGVACILVRRVTKIDFPISVIMGWTAIAYLFTLATRPLNPIKVTFNKQLSATYLLLDSKHNIYHQAQDMRKTGVDSDSVEWQTFVRKAQGEFSLEKLADLFEQQLPNVTIHQQSRTGASDDGLQDFFECRIDTSESSQKPENNADDIVGRCVKSDGNRFYFISTADGSGKGEDPCEDPCVIAKAANRGFVNYLAAVFIKRIQKGNFNLTISELVYLTVLAVDSAQKKTLEAKKSDKEVANAYTTLLGLTVIIPSQGEMVHCCFTSVGDSKLLAKFPDGGVVDLTPMEDRKDVRDPGGQLGCKYRKKGYQQGVVEYGEIPDLRNLTVGYLPLPRGTVLLPMTDGVYDNIDLEKIKEVIQGKTGQLAVDAIINAAKTNPKKTDDTSCAWIEIN